MKTLKIIFLICFSCWSIIAVAQKVELISSGDMSPEPQICLSEDDRKKQIANVKKTIKSMVEKGIIKDYSKTENQESLGLFDWPLRQTNGFNDPNYFAVTNFVDHDHSNGIADYNCGHRTYNGHRGIDIACAPFPWHKMNNNQVEIISTAPGVIIEKIDGNTDTNCVPNSSQWNAVYVQHFDGSVAVYGHMKKNSLTSKPKGAPVAKGEYLGLVGSSGNSSGPHLHFEIYDSNWNLLDPYSGTCNGLNNFSLWENQKPYYETRINKVMTLNSVPIDNACSTPTTIDVSNNFDLGQKFYLFAGFQDLLKNQTIHLKVRRPNNTIYHQWSESINYQHYASPNYTWGLIIGNWEPTGTWKFQVTINNDTKVHYFNVNAASKPDLVVQNIAGPNTVAPGETVSLSCKVRNTGNANSGANYMKYYLSADHILGSNDMYLGYDYVGILPPNNFSSEYFSYSIPNNFSTGTWYILFQADGYHYVNESNENNNVGYKAIQINSSNNIIASIPYSTGFEGGLDMYWTTNSSTNKGRLQVTNAYSPFTGSKHLTMDVSTNNNYNTNQADLHVNLTTASIIDLKFAWKEFGDETNSTDGVYFSDNGGASFVKVFSFNGSSSVNNYWHYETLWVEHLAQQNGLSLSNDFVIRFQQYDNYSMPWDGIAIDAVEVLPYTNAKERSSTTEDITVTQKDGFLEKPEGCNDLNQDLSKEDTMVRLVLDYPTTNGVKILLKPLQGNAVKMKKVGGTYKKGSEIELSFVDIPKGEYSVTVLYPNRKKQKTSVTIK